MTSVDVGGDGVRVWRRLPVSVGIWCALAIGGGCMAAQAAGLPGAATPGGAQPSLQQKIPQPEKGPAFSIPPVMERPLGVDEGPHVVVQRFALEGVVDRPKQGIHRKAIEDLLAARLKAQPKGFTIGQLQDVASEVTRYYRKAGFILAQAYVPAQSVTDGVVTIKVMEGKLGKVVPEGNKRYKAALLERPFADAVGKPVRKSVMESGLLQLTDYPGLSVFGVFRPGETVGTADLVLKVQEEKPYDASLWLDNYGTRYTGEIRGRAAFTWNNPTGGGDALSLNILKTAHPANGTYGSVNYEHPVYAPGYTVGVGANRNSFSVGQDLESLHIKGTTDIAHLYLKRSFLRSRLLNMYGRLELSRKRADITQAGTDIGKDNLSVLAAEFTFDSIDTRFSGINQGLVRLSHGFPNFLGAMDSNGNGNSSRIGGDGAHAGGDFTKLMFQISRLQSITKNQSVMVRLEGQYSNDLLTSLEEMPLGGPHSVRAYPTAELLVDKGVFGSVEYQVNAPGFADKPAFANRTWGEVFQVSVFADFAGGELNDPLPTDVGWKNLSGVGVGLQLQLPGKFLARLDVATPIGSRDASNNRNPQYYLNLGYQF